jgi:hypothetical protein
MISRCSRYPPGCDPPGYPVFQAMGFSNDTPGPPGILSRLSRSSRLCDFQMILQVFQVRSRYIRFSDDLWVLQVFSRLRSSRLSRSSKLWDFQMILQVLQVSSRLWCSRLWSSRLSRSSRLSILQAILVFQAMRFSDDTPGCRDSIALGQLLTFTLAPF